ncbi:MAG TPA: hypothetical protein VN452_08315 [Longilinea sp.]|nr:hypothetical protein [Longilinea sp.]
MDRQRNKQSHRKTPKLAPLSPPPQSEGETITIQGPLWKWDLVSKLRDGLLPAFVLVLLVVVPSLLIPPIQNQFDRPGLLVYMLFLVAVGVMLLAAALHEDQPLIRQTWYGLAGGVITWMATEVSDRLSGTGLTSLNAVPYFLIIGLIVAILWRRVLLLPVRGFALVFFLNWVSRFLVSGEQFLAGYFHMAKLAYLVTAGIGLLGVLTSLFFIILRSRERVQRMRMSVWLWFSTLLVLEILVVFYF